MEMASGVDDLLLAAAAEVGVSPVTGAFELVRELVAVREADDEAAREPLPSARPPRPYLRLDGDEPLRPWEVPQSTRDDAVLVAAAAGCRWTTQALLYSGADPDAPDLHGRRLVDVAKDQETRRLIEQIASKPSDTPVP
jgi:hypothetical protein